MKRHFKAALAVAALGLYTAVAQASFTPTFTCDIPSLEGDGTTCVATDSPADFPGPISFSFTVSHYDTQMQLLQSFAAGGTISA
jgi:hypothetical protein